MTILPAVEADPSFDEFKEETNYRCSHPHRIQISDTLEIVGGQSLQGLIAHFGVTSVIGFQSPAHVLAKDVRLANPESTGKRINL